MKRPQTNSPLPAPEPLRVLLIEHDPADVEIVQHILRRAGFDLACRVVECKEEFLDALRSGEFDVILSDYRLPGWNGMDALALLLEEGRDIPFLLVTGTLGDESAVECIKRGLTDYVLKESLARLPEAIRRARLEKALRVEKARAELSLRISEQRYRTLVEHAPEAIVVLDAATGRFLDANENASRLFGLPREQLLQLGPTELSPAFQPDGSPSEAAARAWIDKATAGETPHFQWTHRSASGHDLPCEIRLVSLPGEKEKLIRGSILDISERVQAEAERNRLITAVEQATEGVVISDPRGVIQYVNPAFVQMTGYSRDTVIGKTPRLLKSGVHDQAFYEHLWKTILAGEIWRGEITNRRKDGSLYIGEMSITPVRDAAGHITHFIAIKKDITERRALEQQLRQAQKFEAIGQLVGGIAHDFNNVIGAILGWAEMGMEQVAPESREFGYFKKMRAQADRAAALIRQLLAFARRQILEPRNLSINQCVADLLSMLETILGKNIEVKTVMAPDLAVVCADPTQIEQVLLNLCINARDAMPRGGRLVIETENIEIDGAYCRLHPYTRPGNYVCVTVSDTGIGMDAATIEHIFEPFFTTKEPGRGTGLGLATAFGIVKQHGGFLNVYSEPGHGSVFRICFPVVSIKADDVSKPEKEETIRGGTETILLAEDHEGVLETACSTLTSLGYQVLPVPDGAAALDLFRLRADTIDLVLLDVVMPHLNGPEAYALMEVLRPSLPVIFTSGYTAETPAFTDAVKRGIPILQKPYSSSQLARKIRDTLDGHYNHAPASSTASATPAPRESSPAPTPRSARRAR